MTRNLSTVLGLAAGLAILAAAGPASAIHIELRAEGTTGVGQVVPDPDEGVTAGTPAVVDLGDPLILFGRIVNDPAPTPNVTFTHTYNFGFDAAGPAGASATPNVLTVDSTVQAGFAEFEAFLTGPTITGQLDLTRMDPLGDPDEPRRQTLAARFAAIDTGGTTPYTLTVFGQLFLGASAGNYTGNIGVVPLPGAAALFLTALGGLAFARRYRRREEEDGMAAAA